MVENSLLDAYRKYNILRKRLYEGQYHEKLKKRLEFYGQEGMNEEYSKTWISLREFELIERDLENVFVKPGKSRYSPNSQFTWNYYFKNADQLLYDRPFVNQFLGREYWETTNNFLLEEIVMQLNKKFPNEQWKLGEIPLFHWQILNYPGYEPTEYEIARWESSSNIHKELGYYYENSSQLTRCIYQAEIGEQLQKSENNLCELKRICSEARENRKVYVIDRDDNECSGGYDLGLEVEFKDNAIKTFYGTELTPQEQVINSTIVREIDTRCARTRDMGIVHERLGDISNRIKLFLTRYGFAKASNTISVESNQDL